MNLIFSIINHWDLLVELTKKDFSERTKSTVLGWFWLIFIPGMQLFIYVFVFSFVLNIKLSNNAGSYPLYIISGIIPWLAFSELLSKSTFLIRANSNLVKQIVFPIETLPLKIALASIITQLVMHFIFLTYSYYVDNSIMGLHYFTYAIVIQFLFYSGLACIISSISVFLQDIKEVVSIFLMIGIYFVPILYTDTMLPWWVEYVIDINPLSHMVRVYQDILFYGRVMHEKSWFIWSSFSIAIFFGGGFIFSYVKRNFGDFV
jgi:lipopolysaccharide transport system permease protein